MSLLISRSLKHRRNLARRIASVSLGWVLLKFLLKLLNRCVSGNGGPEGDGEEEKKGRGRRNLWHDKIAESTGSRYLEIQIYLSQAGGI